jgi:hypothetical protein
VVDGLIVEPFELEALPDSFRYDRRVGVYGINSGIEQLPSGSFRSVDAPAVDRTRPKYWTEGDPPSFEFSLLASEPITSSRALLIALKRWGERHWSESELAERAKREAWSAEMIAESRAASADFAEEVSRLDAGIRLLEMDSSMLRAFR